MEQNIFAQIRREKNDFFSNYITVVPGYSFNQYQTLKRINLYLNSKFEDGGYYLGRELVFFNIVVPACEVATKMLDIDTKDIRLLPLNPKSHFSTYLLEKELKLWLKTSKLANVLNQIADEGPKYGSVVLEKTKEGAKVVDLRRLFIDPTVERITDSRFITTVHYMTPSELEATGWDNVDVAIDRFGKGDTTDTYEDMDGSINQLRSTPYIKVYKRYGEVPAWWLDKKLKPGTKLGEKFVKSIYIVAGADSLEKNSETGLPTGELGVVLFSSKWHKKDYPFKDYHYNKIRGRWLGLGIVESLFDVQVRINELKNQRRFSMEITAMPLLQTKDKTIVRNILTDLQPGDLVVSPNGIEQIAIDERDLAAFNSEEESYISQAQRLSFAYDAVSGESSAASTTATAVINAQQQATSTFGFKHENYANMLRDFFNDLVLPQMLEDLTPEHIMRFTGNTQELDKMDKAAAEIYANDEIKKMVLAGKIPTPEIQQALIDKAIQTYRKLGDSRFFKIKEAFYDDAEFEFDFNVSNEAINPQLLADNTQAVITAVAQNPAVLNDPRIRVLFYKYAEALGVSPAEIELADTQANQMAGMNPAQNGGGVPTPPAQQQPQPAGADSTIASR